MDFGANKKPVEVIRKGEFGGTYFRFWCYWKVVQKVMERFDQLKDIDEKYYCSSYYDVRVNKYGVKI